MINDFESNLVLSRFVIEVEMKCGVVLRRRGGERGTENERGNAVYEYAQIRLPVGDPT